MFNYSGNTSVEINAVSGTIVKNYKDSFFKCFRIGTGMAEAVFDTENPYLPYDDEEKSIVLLQAMLCSGDMVICEIMWKEDFEKLSKDDIQKN